MMRLDVERGAVYFVGLVSVQKRGAQLAGVGGRAQGLMGGQQSLVVGFCLVPTVAVPYRKHSAGLDAPLLRSGKTAYMPRKKLMTAAGLFL